MTADLPAMRQPVGTQPLDRLGLAHEAPQAVNDIDQALVAQQRDRLPRRPPRHAILGHQLMLTGQLLTGLQPPGRDRRTQQVRDLLVDRPIGLRINHGTQKHALSAVNSSTQPYMLSEPVQRTASARAYEVGWHVSDR